MYNYCGVYDAYICKLTTNGAHTFVHAVLQYGGLGCPRLFFIWNAQVQFGNEIPVGDCQEITHLT